MATTTKKACSFCGAPVTNKAMSVCYSCNTPYSFESEGELAPREVRFNEVEEHARFKEVAAQKPSIMGHVVGLCIPILIAIVLFVAARLVRSFLAGPDASSLLVVLSWILSVPLALIGTILLLVGIFRLIGFLNAERITRTALVTRKRTVKEGGSLVEAQGKPLVIHFEFRTENRAEAQAAGALAAKLAVNDIGVAFIKGPYLLDYQKLT